MECALVADEAIFRLKFDGKMTYEYYRELEAKVLDAMQAKKRLEIDLSEVTEIDLCGLHLVGLLQSAGAIVATSPVVADTSRRLLTTLHSAALGRAKRKGRAAMSP